ncbi:hypothetical protein OQX61_03470 [Pedobacter sp. PLR]|uniref:hypothetical protein n=1 Tax=Pedobacter sp. PLR TaxID=2994465 RepID=UPI002246396A|nr:hypothetical protein [Pedobacter sp. PLR]MCX2450322.1 hypothetical protein [Pedobacter sp. PLR]
MKIIYFSLFFCLHFIVPVIAQVSPVAVINNKRPLLNFKGENLNSHLFFRYSSISGYRDGVRQYLKGIPDSISKTHRFLMINFSKVDFLLGLYGHLGNFNAYSPNHIKLKVKDPAIYRWSPVYGNKEDWERKNLISYEALLPIEWKMIWPAKSKSGLIIDVCRLDVANQLKLKFGPITSKEKCLVLYRTSSIDKLKPKGAGLAIDKTENIKQFRNAHFKDLTKLLNSFVENLPVVDETGYKGIIDLDLVISSWTDINSIKKALQAYDLDLKEEEREIKMFLIEERNFVK